MTDKQIEYEARLIWISIYFYIIHEKGRNLINDPVILDKLKNGMKRARDEGGRR